MSLSLVGVYNALTQQVTMTATGGTFPYFYGEWTTPGGLVPSTIDASDPTSSVITVISPKTQNVIFGSYGITVTDSATPTAGIISVAVVVKPTQMAIQITDQFGNVYTKSDVINLPTEKCEHLILTAHIGMPSSVAMPVASPANPNDYLDPKAYKIGWYKELCLHSKKNTVTIKESGIYGILVWYKGNRISMHFVVNYELPLTC